MLTCRLAALLLAVSISNGREGPESAAERDTLVPESAWQETEAPPSPPWLMQLTMPGVSGALTDGARLHVAGQLPAGRPKLYVERLRKVGEDQDTVHHIVLFHCPGNAPAKSAQPYKGLPCVAEGGDPFDGWLVKGSAVRGGGFLACEVHYSTQSASADHSGCEVHLTDQEPPGARERHVLDISVLALPPAKPLVQIADSWQYKGAERMLLKDIWVHFHSKGTGASVMIERAGAPATVFSVDGDGKGDGPINLACSVVTSNGCMMYACDGDSMSTTCGSIGPNDHVHLKCRYDTSGETEWVGYGMTDGEMCSLWLTIHPTADSRPTSQRFVHDWQTRLSTPVSVGAQDLDVADDKLTSEMVSRVGAALGVSDPVEDDGHRQGRAPSAFLERVYKRGVTEFAQGTMGFARMNHKVHGDQL